MKKGNLLVLSAGMLVLFSAVFFPVCRCTAQVVPCYNICQKTVIDRDCWGNTTQTVEFINIACDQECPVDEHIRTVCPCTWEMWREITETDCDGKTSYSQQKIGDYPCGTDPVSDKSYTIPCSDINKQSGLIHRSEKYFIHQNNCICEEFHDVHYQYINMDCKLYCKKTVVREYCNGSFSEDPPEYVEIPCPGDCLPDTTIIDTVCQFECGVITTYYNCDDPETVDYVEPMKTMAYTYNCSGHEAPVCPPDEEYFEDCDVVITGKDLEPQQFKRKVARKYILLWKECTKAIKIITTYEKTY